jgi:hypothetical protein
VHVGEHTGLELLTSDPGHKYILRNILFLDVTRRACYNSNNVSCLWDFDVCTSHSARISDEILENVGRFKYNGTTAANKCAIHNSIKTKQIL